MMRRMFLAVATVALLGSTLATEPARADAFARTAEAFVDSLGARAESMLTGDNLSEEEKARNVYAFIDQTVDVPTIGRFTMGRYWRQASKEQQAEFLDVFRDYVARSVTGRISQMASSSISIQKVVPVTASRPSAKDMLVICQIKLRDRQPLGVVWRVRDTEAGPRLVDVIVDGISMAVVQREEFGSVLRSHEGDIPTFLAALREKTGDPASMVANRAN